VVIKDKNTNSTLIDKRDLPVKGFIKSNSSPGTLNDFIYHFEKKPLLKYLNRVEKHSKEILGYKNDPRIEVVKKILPLIITARNRIDKNEDSGFYIGSIAKLCEKANMIIISPYAERGQKYSNEQTNRVKKRWSKAKIINEIFTRLKDREYEDYHADELWPVFFGLLDEYHLNPIEEQNTEISNSDEPYKVNYDGGSMKFKTFKNRLSQE